MDDFTLNNNVITQLLSIARLAGEEILKVYNSDDYGVEHKTDDSPLTKADKAAHNKIMEYLSITGIPTLSEEGADIPYYKQKVLTPSVLWVVRDMGLANCARSPLKRFTYGTTRYQLRLWSLAKSRVTDGSRAGDPKGWGLGPQPSPNSKLIAKSTDPTPNPTTRTAKHWTPLHAPVLYRTPTSASLPPSYPLRQSAHRVSRSTGKGQPNFVNSIWARSEIQGRPTKCSKRDSKSPYDLIFNSLYVFLL